MRLLYKERKISEEKANKYRKILETFTKYKTIIILDVEGIDSSTVKKVKYFMRLLTGGEAQFLSSKLSIVRKALKDTGLKDYDQLLPYLTGQRVFVLSNLNPFLLYGIITAIKIPSPASPGMVIDREIVIPAGDTGIQPGPILSVFGRLRIPTKVQGGTIWITKDTRVAKPGDVVSPELSSLLQRLGITPIERGVRVLAAYYEGVIIPAEGLKLDLDEYRAAIIEAQKLALSVSIEAVAPFPDALYHALSSAHLRALSVAAEAGIVTNETAQLLLQKALRTVYTVISILGDRAKELGLEVPAQTTGLAAAQPVAPQPEAKTEEKEEEEEEKREISEEDLSAGLSSLFG